MKALMVSKPPKIVSNVLNGLASILIFKTCPRDWKDYLSGKTKEMPKPTDVYIYCTKDGGNLVYGDDFDGGSFYSHYAITRGYSKKDADRIFGLLNGKVVAKFTLNKVEEINAREDEYKEFIYYETSLKAIDFFKKSCLDYDELDNYLYGENGYAWHISNLEIFDKPKELSEFKTPKEADRYSKALNQAYKDDAHIRERLYNGLAEDNECANAVQLTELTEFMWGMEKAPQSWCYIEAIHND